MRQLRLTCIDKLAWGSRACALLLLSVTTVIVSAQTLTTLHNFDDTDGFEPEAYVQATNGSLYGLTGAGGSNLTLCGGSGCGTIFKITPSGKFTSLLSLDGSDGDGPYGPLLQATDGDFYGAFQAGGANLTLCSDSGCGTFFKITAAGTLTTLYNFCSETNCADGSVPLTNIIQAPDGDFYGTTYTGGANCVSTGGCGTVFKITPIGTLTTLYSFCSQSGCADGDYPLAGLVQAANGNFYGTTSAGGTSSACSGGCGTIYKITPSGTLTTLRSFDSTDGIEPRWLFQAANGDFYGTTNLGGASTACTSGCGTVFRITPSGTLTTLHSFDSTDGAKPLLAPQATDGNFYGTTHLGGASTACTDGCGTIFKITPSGKLTTLYSFSGTDGSSPVGLIQDTNGKFYGSTELGGTSSACTGGCGTVFMLSPGLGPFVETQTTSGKIGAPVKILGTNLTGASSVTFNGTAAVFTVVSSSLITTTVPAGATTGKVQVTTSGGTLTSNVSYQVIP
jgi:uncharacterized repeat protein (TIGR03803 family)